MEIGILLILLIGALASLYLAGKLIFKCVRLFRGGHVADALLLASALCAAIGIGILTLNEKSFLGISLLGFMYAVIRGLWVFLHWVDGIPVGSLDNRDRGVNDGVNESGVSHDLFRRKDRDWMFDSQNGLTVGPEGAGSYLHGVRVDSDLGIDHGSSFDNRW
ncbi:hypothetical protein [Burkholderia multivorans]|uniref:hypothetical protein n=1 Tax=Burkholderia multivorans TaxID=87883 RepID=UPI002858F767|nr:hypothetical protein [Burkholderia multivorans]MDR9065295.1 hypothetical protein [Burkholderia multivorans]MDR9091839.1 hypothetical protein [Burkholderia multivorans]MDR9117661.1 hypothetical protein [Burkholderia multivorans]MDR9157268.1 hypothetical protein [Burkholderia multivorans]MDR9164846.1 hypothetical protein [Burkholderia multivorans]